MNTPKIKASQRNQIEAIAELTAAKNSLTDINLRGFPDKDKKLFMDILNSLTILRSGMDSHVAKNLSIEDYE